MLAGCTYNAAGVNTVTNIDMRPSNRLGASCNLVGEINISVYVAILINLNKVARNYGHKYEANPYFNHLKQTGHAPGT